MYFVNVFSGFSFSCLLYNNTLKWQYIKLCLCYIVLCLPRILFEIGKFNYGAPPTITRQADIRERIHSCFHVYFHSAIAMTKRNYYNKSIFEHKIWAKQRKKERERGGREIGCIFWTTSLWIVWFCFLRQSSPQSKLFNKQWVGEISVQFASEHRLCDFVQNRSLRKVS